jgi:hypothetical protein
MTALSVASEARARVDRIKTGVEVIWSLIVESYQARDWEALGYATWDEMCTREFGTSRLRLPREERAETVQSLREAGLSVRAIASVTGDSKSTVAAITSGVQNRTPAAEARQAEPIVDRKTGEVLATSEELADLAVYDDVSEGEFETALIAAREQGDLSRENVVANLPPHEVEPTPVTGLDGKQYHRPVPKPAAAKRREKPLGETAKDYGFEIRSQADKIRKLLTHQRYAANEKQVADALRGHLLYVAETVAAVLDQLP